MVVDEVAAITFNVVGDLSRTQQMTVYQQLQAGVRVLDLRLAVNPWMVIQQRSAPAVNNQQMPKQQTDDVFTLQTSPTSIQGVINMEAAGGPLSATELTPALVAAHSLPAAPLDEVLRDLKQFLAEYPTEVVLLLIKADTVSVNAAGIQRMHDVAGAWAAAASVIRKQLAENQTIGEFTAGAAGGSVLLHSDDLFMHGMHEALGNPQLQMLESWGNGTDSEGVDDLQSRLSAWMSFWSACGWATHSGNKPSKPFMLLASAEVTLGVTGILEVLWHRLWHFQSRSWAPALQGQLQAIVAARHAEDKSRAFGTTEKPLLREVAAAPADLTRQQIQDNSQDVLPAGTQEWLGGARSLYEIGVHTNQQLLSELLQQNEAPLSFNIWSLDALNTDVVSFVINLNDHDRPPAQQTEPLLLER
eukprot:gene10932-11086_t